MIGRTNNNNTTTTGGRRSVAGRTRNDNKKKQKEAVDVSSSNRDDDDDDDDDDDYDNAVIASSAFVLTFMGLPTTLRLDILNFLGETQEEMRTLTVISKQLYKDIKQSSIEWPEFIPLIEISPTKGGSTESLFQSLQTHQTNNDPNNPIQTTPYRTMKVNNVHKFDEFSGYNTLFTMDRITSLNISSLPSGTTFIGNCYYLPYYLACISPNLLEIDLSNSPTAYRIHNGYYHSNAVIQQFTKKCHRLEKITWNNVRSKTGRGFISLNGVSMLDADNLRNINMDNSDFESGSQDKMSDLNNHPNMFIFHECCKSLERVSLRNARYKNDKTPIKQEALIKFVRSVPTLRWFRSDLRQENINLLTKEFSDIEFC